MCLHPKRLRSKNEASGLAAKITNEIVFHQWEGDIYSLSEAVGNGQTFCGGDFLKRPRKSLNWDSQQVFSVDVDNKNECIPKHVLIEHYRGLNVPPNLSYNSLSSTPEKPKYRLMWILNKPIRDPKRAIGFKRWLINNSNNCADPACINLDRLYFGGRDSEIHSGVFLDSENIPFAAPKEDKFTEKKPLSVDWSQLDSAALTRFRIARLSVDEAMGNPYDSKWGSRHQTIFKGCIYLIETSHGLWGPDELSRFIKSRMDKYPEVWQNYDRPESVIEGWIQRAYKWSLENVLDND